MRKAVFLDRDNTLIYDPGYIHEVDKVKLLDGVGEGLKLLKEAGYLLIVVSNQSGIGRGYFTEREFWEVNYRLQELLEHFNVQIDDFFFCPHRPGEGCKCRKPGTLMVEKAVEKWKIDVKESFVIGDKDIDVELAFRAGCRGGIKVGVPCFENFLKAASFIVGEK
ncbi:D-glycero-D-manno-heptose 1,7-bisphosphate phosphatase [Thermovibrio guaymasensis]|uniref:D,D-heptose 1,7-bisphosphate phosphatase n=1 Tax=Thermovibrio guaymasensis TaxID=240167 RepID=A0A420W5I5_9BACT|nr:HAD family hydrolase [Thermovibrio guaymasensis]RKQ60322.1 D-glycero-D-manno-heptose 1,7-bisphosphate phosphatase [Thermovibrio guaymasensis]